MNTLSPLLMPKKCSARLLAAVLTVMLLFTACSSGIVRISKEAQVEEKLSLGQKYLNELNYEDAIIAFTETIELDPENIPAYMGRAEAYRGTEQYDEAKADYSTVIEKTAEQPYEQANAYVGRAEINELTQDEQDALNDYEDAAKKIEAVDIEQITDVTEQALEALKIKIYNACARLNAFFGRHEAAVAAYTNALNSLAKLPDDTDVIDVADAKRTAYAGRAASNMELEAYEAVLPDYDALIELGEDKAAERDTLLAAISLARSKATDLGSAAAWLAEVNHAEYAESSGLNAMIGTLQSAADLAADSGTDAYKAIKEALTTDEAQQAMKNILAGGYQLRWYDQASGNMLSVYTTATAWDDVNDEENGMATPELLEALATSPTDEEVAAVKLTPMYVYWGGHENRSREGDGTWYILNPGNTDLNAKAYTWENDKPKNGFEKKVVETPVQWITYHNSENYSKEQFGGREEYAQTRNTDITYGIGGKTVRVYEVWTYDLTGEVYITHDVTFILSQPVQSISKGTYGATFYVPSGTVIKIKDCPFIETYGANGVYGVESVTIKSGESQQFNYAGVGSYGMTFAAK